MGRVIGPRPLLCLLAIAAVAIGLAGGTAAATDSIPGWNGTAPDEHSLEGDDDGPVEVIVETTTPWGADVPSNISVDRLRAISDTAREPLERHATRSGGVSVERRFRVGNAALVSVDPDRYDPAALADVPGVERVYPNVELTPQTATSGSSVPVTQATGSGTTYGLEQVNATTLWDAGHTGHNATVAVIDTGIDTDHPDLSLPADGWAHFDNDGARTNESPHDPDGHGTHVSGTVVGDRLEDGRRYGVAPNATLLHAGVMENDSMTLAAVIGAMEWVIEHERDVDVMSLSLGGSTIGLIEPVRSAEAAGLLVVASSGNDGAGTSVSPANVYESIAVGATDQTRGVAGFSGSEAIDVPGFWGTVAPQEWPSIYTVPSVTAPGVRVCSSVVGGGYGCSWSGTSMATPHVSGVAALLVDAVPNRSADDLTVALRESASIPAGGDSLRYGEGIVDAWRANATQIGRLTGTVVDTSGMALEDAVVRTANGPVTTTDGNGTFQLTTSTDEQTLLADAMGYHAASTTVTPNGTAVTLTLADRHPDASIVETPDAHVRPGFSTRIGVRIGNANGIRLTTTNGSTLPGEDVSITLDGEPLALDEHHEFNSTVDDRTVLVDVDTAADAFGVLDARVEVFGNESTSTLPLKPVAVHATPITVAPDGGDTDSIQAAIDMAVPGSTIQIESGTYAEGPTPNGSALAIDTPVVLEAPPGADPVVTGGPGSERGLGISRPARVNGLTVNGSGLETGATVQDNATATISNATISRADTAMMVTDNGTASIDNSTLSGRVGLSVDGSANVDRTAVTADTGITVAGSIGRIANTTITTAGPHGIALTETVAAGSIANVSITGTNRPGQVGLLAETGVTSLSRLTVANVSTGIDLQGDTAGITNSTISGPALTRGLVLNGTAAFGITDVSVSANASDGVGIRLEESAVSSIGRVTTDRGRIGIEARSNQTTIQQSDLAGVQTAIHHAGDDIVASENYYGADPRQSNGTIVGSVRYGPFVTDPGQVHRPPGALTAFAYHLSVAPGELQAVAFPGGANRTLRESIGHGAGAIWAYDGGWTRVTDLDRRPDPFDVFVIRSQERLTVTIEPNLSSTASRHVDAGWSLVGAPSYGSARGVFDAMANASLVLNRFALPATEPAENLANFDDQWAHSVLHTPGTNHNVSAHSGYFLYSQAGDALTRSGTPATDLASYRQALAADDLGSMTETAPLNESTD